MFSFLVLICLSLLLFLIHALLPKRKQTSGERQRSLIVLILIANAAGVGVILAIGIWSAFPWARIWATLIYFILGFNSVAYSYFHMFNMSETARRIRILFCLEENREVEEDLVVSNYSPASMLRNRLDRLIQFGEISRTHDGTVELRRRRFLNVAYLFRFLRRWVMGKNVDRASS